MTEATDYPQGDVSAQTLQKHFDDFATLMQDQQHVADELRAAKAAASADNVKPSVLVALVRERMKAAKVGEDKLAAEDALEEEYREKLGLG